MSAARRPFWDTSALVLCVTEEAVYDRLTRGGMTRPHSLAELFSTLTGGKLRQKMTADFAAKTIEGLAEHLEFVDLDADEVLDALKQARKLGVRGGRVHDFMQGEAARVHRAAVLITGDRHDFAGLTGGVPIEIIRPSEDPSDEVSTG